MTDQTNAAQPVLTDSEILAIGAMHGRPSVALLPMFRAFEGAVLSKLRAPVAGESQIIGYVPPIYLEMRRRGMPVNSKIQHSPGDDATAPLYAAPQATTEARPSLDAVDLARAGMALHAPGAPEHTVCAELVRLADMLKQPQADKDGGQQRACTCHADDRPAGDCQKQYAATDCQQRAGDECKHARAHRAGDRQGYACPDCGEFVSDYEIHRRQRAALSAPQADGIRRPLPYIDSTQEPPK